MKSPTYVGVRSLISFAIQVTEKSKSPQADNPIDYSVIDCLCSALGKSPDKVNLEALLMRVLQATAKEAVAVAPLPFFRLMHGLLSTGICHNAERLTQLIDLLSPSHFPHFACCWIQLCMHRLTFPKFVRINSHLTTAFCVNFVGTCLELAARTPEVFYRPVERILLTISASAPLLFVSYHMLFLSHLPMSFTQFRNIILSAPIPSTEEGPPIGFSVVSELQLTGLDRLVVDGDLTTPKLSMIVNAIKKAVKSEGGVMPALVWQFVLFFFQNVHRGAADPIVKICDLHLHDSVRWIIVAIADQVRYQNAHTTIAMDVLTALYARGRDDVKEIVLLELVRRLMCVTPPPAMLFKLFAQIDTSFGVQLDQFVKSRGAGDVFEHAREFVKNCPMSKSPSSFALRG
jgi:hypothetical protein